MFPANQTTVHITGLQLGLSGKVFPVHQTTHYSLAVGAIRTSVRCPPDYKLQPCGWGYQDKCSLPTRLQITGWRLGLSGQVFPAHQTTYYSFAVGAIRTSVPCPPNYILQPCGWLGLSGHVFPANYTTHYRLAVGAIRTSVPCLRDYTLQPNSWGYQNKCSLPTRLHITGLRLGLSGQVFPAHQNTHNRLAVGAIRTSVPCQLDCLRLGLSGQVFPAHQTTYYRLAVGAIRTSVPCPPEYTLQACGWGYQDKCSLPTRLLAAGAIRTSVPCPPNYILQFCSWGYQDKCSLPTKLHITVLQLGLSGQVFPAN